MAWYIFLALRLVSKKSIENFTHSSGKWYSRNNYFFVLCHIGKFLYYAQLVIVLKCKF